MKLIRTLYHEERGCHETVAGDDKYFFLKDKVKIYGTWYDGGAGTNKLRDLLTDQFGITPLVSEIDLDNEPLPYADSSIDVASSFELIEHVLNPLFVMREIYRVLKPGGSLYMTTPDSYCAYHKIEHLVERKYKAHFHEFIQTDLEWLLHKSGFTNFKIERFARENRSKLLKIKPVRFFVDGKK